MQPLIKIQSIPIKIEAQTRRASLQASTEPAPAPQRKSAPAPRPAPAPVAPQRPQARQQAETPQPQPDNRVNQNRTPAQRNIAQEGSSNYLQEASNAVRAYNQSGAVDDVNVPEVAYAAPAPVEYQTPAASSPAPMQNTPSTSFDYSMDRETFDWNANAKPQLEYVPASIEYSVSQYPEVVIEYVGEPIYVPASSNPNYVPPPEAKGKA